jgi:hypothetical protein
VFRLRSTALLTITALTALVATPVAATAAPVTPAKAPAPWVSCVTDPNLAYPAVCLPDGFGEDQPAPLGTGETIEFDALVVNHGAASPGGVVTITLPAGLRMATADESDDGANPVRYDSADDYENGDGTPLTCTATNGGATVSCPTGALAANAVVLVGIWLTSKPTAPAGGTGTFTVALDPTLPAPHQTTSVQATVDYTGAAHLSVRLAPRKTTVVVGKSADIVATIHNDGPDPAPDAASVGLIKNGGTSHFVITNAPDPLAGGPAQRVPAVAVRVVSRKTSAYVGIWPLGTIAAHATVHFTVRVKGVSAGADALFVVAGSAAADPVCNDDAADDLRCSGDQAQLTAVRAPAPAKSTHAATHHGDGTANLAASGPEHLGTQLLVALLALLLGLAATIAGRRPRYSARH